MQSLARAFAIMEEIARNRDGIGLADLSKRVGLHNSTTFHLVKTLVSLGYVRQMPDSKRYRIGRPLFALAASALDEVEMVSLATPILEDLSRETGESAHFSVRMDDAVVVLARTGGKGAFQLNDRAGAVRPAHCTALGKIMLAALPVDQFERYLTRADLKSFTPKSITAAESLRREIAEVRRTGLAIDDGEFDAEVRCAVGAGSRFQRSDYWRHWHFGSSLAVVDRGAAETGARRSCRRRPVVGGIRICRRRQGCGLIIMEVFAASDHPTGKS